MKRLYALETAMHCRPNYRLEELFDELVACKKAAFEQQIVVCNTPDNSRKFPKAVRLLEDLLEQSAAAEKAYWRYYEFCYGRDCPGFRIWYSYHDTPTWQPR